MLDLNSTSVCEECMMVCRELQYEDVDEDHIVYGDQGINAEEYEKTTLIWMRRREESEPTY